MRKRCGEERLAANYERRANGGELGLAIEQIAKSEQYAYSF